MLDHRSRSALALMGMTLAVISKADAQPAHLVRDINETVVNDAPLTPAQAAVVGGVLYFSGTDEANGRELWRSDGTDAGTRLVMDIHPGPNSPGAGGPAAMGTTVLFSGNDGVHGSELWRTEGTQATTQRVTDTDWTTGVYWQGELGGCLLFRTTDPSTGTELWITDGTPAGTHLVKDIHPGSGSSYPAAAYTFQGFAYFTADDGITGRELWRTDGSEAGTTLVKDVNPSGQGEVGVLAAHGGTLFLTANDGVHGSELWKTDGTAAGTVMVRDIRPGAFGSFPSGAVVLGGKLVFWATDEATGRELWTSDGTEAGTVLHLELVPGPDDELGSYTTQFGDIALFSVFSGAKHGLWRTDGTAAGTRRVLPAGGPNHPSRLTAAAGSVYFHTTGATGPELWRSDGTETGTVRVGPLGALEPGDYGLLIPFAEGVAYAVKDGDGTELWYADADENRPIRPRAAWAASSRPGSVAGVGGNTLFIAEDERGRELWQTDATPAGTSLLRDFCVGCPPTLPGYAGPYFGPVVDGLLVMGAGDLEHGLELWTTDGTAAGTRMALDLAPGPSPSGLNPLIVHEGWLYFTAYPNGYGLFRWRPGHQSVRLDDTYTATPVSLGHVLVYGADELMRTDGTPEGTVQVKDVLPGEYNSRPRELVRFRGDVLFQAFTEEAGYETWRTNGTTTGTRLVKDVCPGPCYPPSGYYPLSIPAAGRDSVFFAHSNGVSGRELWKTDGSEAGTVLVKDIHPSGSSEPWNLVEMNGRFYFTADDGVHGRELWTTDGTEAGTHMVKDINPTGHGAPVYGSLADVGGVLLLPGYRPDTGVEIWRSDGTEQGTYALQDIAPGPSSSMPYFVGRVGARIYLSANDGQHGRELYSMLAPTRFSTANVSAVEGGIARFEVRAEGVTSAPVVVGYATSDVTATAGADYTAASGLLTFSSTISTHFVDVEVLADTSLEPFEVFSLDLTLVGGIAGPQTTRAEATIDDDDAPTLALSPPSVVEGDAGATQAAVRVELRTVDGQPTSQEVVVSYESSPLTATAGVDFTASEGSLTFAAGTPTGASRLASTDVLGDTVDEPDELFRVRFVEQTSLHRPQDTEVKIRDDDGAALTDARELTHGAVAWSSLVPAGSAPDRDWYLLKQQPNTSYEIVVDAPSGDIQPLALQRIAADGVTVLTNGSPVGTGGAVSLRWRSAYSTTVQDEKIVVGSGGCGPDCGADDVYRVRAYETTASIPRYVNEGSLKTFVLLQNPTNETILHEIAAWRTDGSWGSGFFGVGTLLPRASAVIPVDSTASGSLTIAHDGPYGGLVGKAVTIDASTGFSFDTPMTYRPR